MAVADEPVRDHRRWRRVLTSTCSANNGFLLDYHNRTPSQTRVHINYHEDRSDAHVHIPTQVRAHLPGCTDKK